MGKNHTMTFHSAPVIPPSTVIPAKAGTSQNYALIITASAEAAT